MEEWKARGSRWKKELRLAIRTYQFPMVSVIILHCKHVLKQTIKKQQKLHADEKRNVTKVQVSAMTPHVKGLYF